MFRTGIRRGRRMVMQAARESEKSVEEKYTSLSPQQHVLRRPDMYVGSKRVETVRTWVVDGERDVCLQACREVAIVPALVKIVDEILVNVSDNYIRTLDTTSPTTELIVKITDHEIMVQNNGKCVDVEWHKKSEKYCPELVFGDFKAGSNFNDAGNRITGGRNGIGAKATNALSHKFTVEIGDKSRKRLYCQSWFDSMDKFTTPEITEDYEGDEFTRITFSPMLEYFGMTHLDEVHRAVIQRRVVDIAACCNGLSVILNGKRLPIRSFEEYVRCRYAEDDEEGTIEPSVYFTKFNGTAGNKGIELPWEIAVGVRKHEPLSFVNAVNTTEGGSHVNVVQGQIIDALQYSLFGDNHSSSQRFIIRDNLGLYIKCLIANPEFSSQSKDKLTYPRSQDISIDIPEEFLQQICSSPKITEPIIDAWNAATAYKSEQNAKNRAKKILINKLEDANFAGTDVSYKCKLILTEGDSAKSLAVAGLAEFGRDYWGVMPLRGKLLNISRGSNEKKAAKNVMLREIQTTLGLDVNKTYATQEDKKTLRYGSVVLMCDQDPDGNHIKGLIINWIRCLWPALLKDSNFLKQIVTPLIKAIPKKGEEKWFFAPAEYLQWAKKLSPSESSKYKIKYYKGLGSSTSKEGKEYFRQLNDPKRPLLVDFTPMKALDEKALSLAFDDGREDDRKKMLSGPQEDLDTSLGVIDIHSFIHTDLANYFRYSNERAVPCSVDGLKPSQRKVLFTCFETRLEAPKELKVAQLSGAVAQRTAYHHGETSLHETIIKLAQEFVGSGNNVPLLEPIGQFGTRLGGGSDHASPRYITTRLTPLARLLFPEADDCLLDYRSDEGHLIEPEYYVPVVPVALVNSIQGIGTGYATKIPSYDPLVVISLIIHFFTQSNRTRAEEHDTERRALRVRAEKNRKQVIRKINSDVKEEWEKIQRTSNKKSKILEDRDYHSRMVKEDVRRKYAFELKKTRDSLKEYESMQNPYDLFPWYQGHSQNGRNGESYGTFTMFEDTAEVSELPVGEWTDTFKGILDKLSKNKTINKYDSTSTDTEVGFCLYFQKAKHRVVESFLERKLKRKLTAHITLFETNKNITNYVGTTELVNCGFFDIRMDMYRRRKEQQLIALQDQINELSNRILFAKVFTEKNLVTASEDKVIQILLSKGVKNCEELYKKTTCSSLSKEQISKREDKLKGLHEQSAVLKNVTIEEMWRDDLYRLARGYISFFGLKGSEIMERLDNAPDMLRQNHDEEYVSMIL